MSLIEQLGGYEKVKSKLMDNGSLHGERIKKALLQYRRENNIYEVGDKVIIVQKVWGEDPWDDLCYVFNAETHHIVGVGIDISVGFGSSNAYRHATPEEIEAGHRL